MQDHGLRAVAEEDHEAGGAAIAQPFHEGAKSSRCIACSDDFVKLESWHLFPPVRSRVISGED
jgi:hypothetical protein